MWYFIIAVAGLLLIAVASTATPSLIQASVTIAQAEQEVNSK